MEIVFVDPEGDQLTLPVTPSDFRVEKGREVEGLDMAQAGKLHLAGLRHLFREELEVLLPKEARTYTAPGYQGQPYDLVAKLVDWSERGTVLRLIITQTPINEPVLLGPVRYGQQDGTGDVTAVLSIRQYRERAAPQNVRDETGNRPRQPATPPIANQYTVVRGDCLWHIARRFYGDGSLAVKLAAANGIPNPNLIFPGQVLRLPARAQL